MNPDALHQFRTRNLALLTPADDAIHSPVSNEWFEHETWWFWFFVPERNIGCWMYHYVRPNIGVSGGGVFAYDEHSYHHLEMPYYLNYGNMPMPDTSTSGEVKFKNGFTVTTLKPFEKYRLQYKDRNIIRFDLEWEAIMAPWVDAYGEPVAPHHLDQFGLVTGEFELHGEKMQVHCHAMRDRTWCHKRPEPWKDGAGGGAYMNASAGPETGFLGAGKSGFLILDGICQPLVAGTFTRERDPDEGYVKQIIVNAVDEQGRKLEAVGESLSRMALPLPGCHGVCWQSLMHYTINGIDAWGEDQDAWPLNLWSAFRRRHLGLPDVRAGELDKLIEKFPGQS